MAELRAGLVASFWLSRQAQTVLRLLDDHTLDDILLAVCLVGPDLLEASDDSNLDLDAPIEHPFEIPVETWIALLRIPFLRAIILARYPASSEGSVPDTDPFELAGRVNAERLVTRLGEFRERAVPTAAVRELLGGITHNAVADRVRHQQLLAAKFSGRWYFPDWQFGAEGAYPGLSEVVTALLADGRGPLAADALMRTPLPEEGARSPADLLAEGKVDVVLHYITMAGGGF